MRNAMREILIHSPSSAGSSWPKAGCTIAGVLTMEDGRIRSVLARTIQEATRVASELGKDAAADR